MANYFNPRVIQGEPDLAITIRVHFHKDTLVKLFALQEGFGKETGEYVSYSEVIAKLIDNLHLQMSHEGKLK